MNHENQMNHPEALTPPEDPAFAGWKKKTAIYLASQTMSLFGSALVQYAIIWYVTLTTESGLLLSLSTISAFLPQIVISLFAGVWADRYNRKLLIILSDLLTAASTLVLALFFFFGYRELWLVFLVTGIRSIGAGIQMPAVSALLPQIVPADKLLRINGINSSIQPFIFLIAPLVSGGLMTFSRLEYIFFIDVITALIAVGLLLALSVPAHARAESAPATDYLTDLKEGIAYIRGNRLIRALFTFFGVIYFFVAPAAFLTPLLVSRTYGEEVWRLTANEVVFFIGSILGGVLMSTWGGFKNHFRTIGFACVVASLLFAGLGVANNFVVYLVIMFLAGIPMPMFNVPTTTMLQETVALDMQGRVFGVMQMIMTTIMPVGMLVFGPLADVVSVEALLIFSGIVMAIPGLIIFRSRALDSAAAAKRGLAPAD